MLGSVKHGGSLGDLVYGLWPLKMMGGCKSLIISSKNMTPSLFHIVLPLLKAQSYVGKVEWMDEYEEYSNRIEMDMDVFRGDLARKQPKHIVQAYVNMLNRVYRVGLPDFDGKPWLENVPTVDISGDFVCVNRSFRYRNPHFDYSRYIGDNPVAFFGVKSEFEDFGKQYPQFKNMVYIPVPNLLMAAALIRRSLYFVGNQSVGSALAQGLGHPQIQEFYPSMPDCMPSVALEGQPYVANWKITETDYIVTGDLVFPEFKIPRCRRDDGTKTKKPKKGNNAPHHERNGKTKGVHRTLRF